MKTEETKENVCLACKCPCPKHTTHTHSEMHDTKGVCEHCGHEHHEDGHCDCGCS